MPTKIESKKKKTESGKSKFKNDFNLSFKNKI